MAKQKQKRSRLRDRENQGFCCLNCGCDVMPLNNGSYRNHCPQCLWSLHVDAARPGDRASTCMGLMEPYEIVRSKKKGFQVVHRCTQCGKTQPNKLALTPTGGAGQSDFEAMLAFLAKLNH